VLDVDALAPASLAVDGRGLHPALAAAVARLVKESSGAVRMVSGRRSLEEQTALWNEALRRYGSPEAADDWVARPGTSAHERGVAVDLGGDLVLADRLIDELGLPLHRPWNTSRGISSSASQDRLAILLRRDLARERFIRAARGRSVEYATAQ
jgi:hypothetical protein